MMSGRLGLLAIVSVLTLACSGSYYFYSSPQVYVDKNQVLVLPIGPYLIPGNPGELLVGAQLPDGTQGVVEAWPEGQPQSVVQVPLAEAWDRISYARLTGLEPGQRYQYRIRVGDARTAVHTVLPTAKKDQPFTVLITGDSKLGCRQAHCKVVKEMEKHPADLYLHLGDLVRTGDNVSDWGEFFLIQERLLARMPLAPVLGNHDRSLAGFFKNVFLLPQMTGGTERYFAFRYGNSLFAVLDMSDTINEGDSQYDYIESALKSAREEGIMHIFVALHSPLFSSGKHGADPGHRKVLLPLFEKYGVTACFSGHDHHYERSHPQNGVVHVVSGGAGAKLTPVNQQAHAAKVLIDFHFLKITVNGPEVVMQAISPSGQVLDEARLK